MFICGLEEPKEGCLGGMTCHSLRLVEKSLRATECASNPTSNRKAKNAFEKPPTGYFALIN